MYLGVTFSCVFEVKKNTNSRNGNLIGRANSRCKLEWPGLEFRGSVCIHNSEYIS